MFGTMEDFENLVTEMHAEGKHEITKLQTIDIHNSGGKNVIQFHNKIERVAYLLFYLVKHFFYSLNN